MNEAGENYPHLQLTESLAARAASSSWLPDEHTDLTSRFTVIRRRSKDTRKSQLCPRIGPETRTPTLTGSDSVSGQFPSTKIAILPVLKLSLFFLFLFKHYFTQPSLHSFLLLTL